MYLMEDIASGCIGSERRVLFLVVVDKIYLLLMLKTVECWSDYRTQQQEVFSDTEEPGAKFRA